MIDSLQIDDEEKEPVIEEEKSQTLTKKNFSYLSWDVVQRENLVDLDEDDLLRIVSKHCSRKLKYGARENAELFDLDKINEAFYERFLLARQPIRAKKPDDFEYALNIDQILDEICYTPDPMIFPEPDEKTQEKEAADQNKLFQKKIDDKILDLLFKNMSNTEDLHRGLRTLEVAISFIQRLRKSSDADSVLWKYMKDRLAMDPHDHELFHIKDNDDGLYEYLLKKKNSVLSSL